MFERAIAVADVRAIIDNGTVIEDRSDDLPYPSRLVLGFVHGRPLHVVVAEDRTARTRIVVTVDEPDPTMWLPGFRRRRRR